MDGGWVLNGQKRWIGNATFADVICIWARNLDTKQARLAKQTLTIYRAICHGHVTTLQASPPVVQLLTYIPIHVSWPVHNSLFHNCGAYNCSVSMLMHAHIPK